MVPQYNRFTNPPARTSYAAEEPLPGRSSSFIDIVKRRKGTIALFTAGCGLAAFLITIPQTRIFRSHVSLEFAGVNDNVLNTRDVDPSATGDSSSQAFINTQARVLESTPLLARVIQRVRKTERPDAPDREKKALENLNPAALSRSISVRPGEVTKLIDLYVDSPDPNLSASLANAMADEYMRLDAETHTEASKRTSQWLGQQVEEARNKLEKSESALQDYARRSDLVFTGTDGSVSEARLREIQEEYSKAQADRVAKQAVYEGLLNEKPDDVNASLKDSALQDYQMKLSELNRQLADLQTTYQPGYQKVQRVRSQIEELKRDYAKQRDGALGRLRNDYQTAQRREDMLAKEFRGQQGIVTKEAATTIDYNILKREAETNRTIYEGMMQKGNSYSIASAMQPNNAHVVDPAEAPVFPFKPNVPLVTVFGLMGGAFFGLIWVGIRDKGEINVEYPGQTNTVLQTSELGVVPSARLDPYLSARHQRQLPAPEPNAIPKRMETAMWFYKSSLMAESVRSIRTSMLARPKTGTATRVAVVTSLNPGHGKTSLVSNLGISYAELRKRVLLIDADVRSPGLHSIFGLPNGAGLTTFLEENAPLDAIKPESYIQQTNVPWLSLMSSGPFRPGTSSSSLLHSERMAELLRHLRRSYDAILIDTPPLTLADARILGPLADGVVLVLRAGEVRMDSVLAAEQLLEQDGSKVLGTVLNDWDPRSNGYGVYPERYHDSSYFKTADVH